MQIKIEPHDHVPVHVQLEEQLKFLILNGDLEVGTKLPTTRQLAGFLRINRNTVAKAFRSLAQEGLIECRQGRGCIVVERPADAPPSIPPQVLEIIDAAIERAVELGVGPGDFASLVYARSRQRRDLQVKHKLMVVECEPSIATAMARAIQGHLKTDVIPVTLSDLRQSTSDAKARLREVDVVATTFFHVQEVKQLLAGTDKEVVAVGVKPHLQNLIQVAQIPEGTPTALVCVSEDCALDLRRSLTDAGITGLETVLGGVDDIEKLARTLARVPVVVVSDFVAGQVRPLVRTDQELIVLDYMTLDEGAVNLLKFLTGESTQED